MNKSIIRSTATVLMASIVLSSCQKEKSNNNNETCGITMANISGTYRLTALKYTASASSPEIDYLAFMEDCEKDDLVILHPAGTYNYQDIGTVCTPNGSNSGTWSLTGKELFSDGVIGGTISSFDCKKLVFFVEDLNKPGDKLAFTMTKQ